MPEPTSNERSTLFGILNSTVGKVTLVITFVTTVFTAFRLLGGDSRLAIIVLFVVGTGRPVEGSLARIDPGSGLYRKRGSVGSALRARISLVISDATR